SACGKVILFGEHAVVYGRPALAVPLREKRAWARAESRTEPGVMIHARELDRHFSLDTAPADDALATVTRAALQELGAARHVGIDLWIESDIPLGSGMGSSAAV